MKTEKSDNQKMREKIDDMGLTDRAMDDVVRAANSARGKFHGPRGKLRKETITKMAEQIRIYRSRIATMGVNDDILRKRAASPPETVGLRVKRLCEMFAELHRYASAEEVDVHARIREGKYVVRVGEHAALTVTGEGASFEDAVRDAERKIGVEVTERLEKLKALAAS